MFVAVGGDTGDDVGAVSMDDERSINWLLNSEANERDAVVSPDGRWLAYVSDESGQEEVYVRPFPNVGDGRWPVSTDGGGEVVWGPDSQELFYQHEPGDATTMMIVLVDTGATFAAGSPTVLFEGPYRSFGGERGYSFDISPDGERFLMIKQDQRASQPLQGIVILNWFEELTRLVPTP